ncbi:MAG: YbaK/EbsC family protein [Nocardioidaceae bacterium]
MNGPGTLRWSIPNGDLVAAPVAAALRSWPAHVLAAPIDPALADTAAFCERYEVAPEDSANCVVVAGRRGGEERIAACVVRADTRADVNTLVKRTLDVRKASFLAMQRAVEETGMEYGGITPVGLPAPWRLLVDAAVTEIPVAIIGSGVRRSKLLLAGSLLGELPGVEVLADLGIPGARPGESG